jgi:hypothetical protein
MEFSSTEMEETEPHYRMRYRTTEGKRSIADDVKDKIIAICATVDRS